MMKSKGMKRGGKTMMKSKGMAKGGKAGGAMTLASNVAMYTLSPYNATPRFVLWKAI